MIIALVAGEASGDQLGAALIKAILAKQPDARFVGIGGPKMKSAGMDTWWDCGELSVMGLFEVIKHVPRLLNLRRQLVTKLLELKPDLFVGIDAPDFNLGVERKLKKNSIRVVHYVSPTIWAWRAGRVKTIAKSTDRVLCLFPFEPDYYARESMQADYTGHPLADQIPPGLETAPARTELGVDENGTYIALLPGSRLSEVSRLTSPMLDAATILARRYPGSRFLVPAASKPILEHIRQELEHYTGLDCQLVLSHSKKVVTAADLVICASGTATLEVMLINRPMVVCYRLSGMTYTLGKWLKLVKSRFFSLPNILANEPLVPELLQDAVNGENIAIEASKWLDQPGLRTRLETRFGLLHQQLRMDAAASAARVVLQHVAEPEAPTAPR